MFDSERAPVFIGTSDTCWSTNIVLYLFRFSKIP